MAINDAEMKQNEFISIAGALNNYFPRDEKYIEANISLLNNAKKCYERRGKNIEGFKKEIFTLVSDGEFEKRTSKNQ